MINQQTLKELAEELNKNNITWGIGGSFLLQLYGLYSNPNDVDLWIYPSDMRKVKEIFFDFQQIECNTPLPEEYHLKIIFHDLEVDFVACFITQPNKNRYIYNISPENIRLKQLENGYEIPCTYLEDWYIVYKLLKRADKASLIEDLFQRKQLPISGSVLINALKDPNNRIPKQVSKDTYKMLWKSLQLSIDDFFERGNKDEFN